MTRDQCIEAMARAMCESEGEWLVLADMRREQATAAYDAMADHIRAREEAVRERCVAICERRAEEMRVHRYPAIEAALRDAAGDIRALDIGGKTDG